MVDVEKLEDSNGRKFLIEEKLKKRGLPIFVFEDEDAESMIQDEGERVKEAYANTKQGFESYRENKLDIAEK